MNKEKWKNCKSMSRLAVKLAEETGEVAAAHLDVLEVNTEIHRRRAITHLRTELEHVQFIALCMENLAIEAFDSEVSVL